MQDQLQKAFPVHVRRRCCAALLVFTAGAASANPASASAMPNLASHLGPLQQTYPVVNVTPDGGVVVAAGKTLVKYSRNGDRFSKEFSYDNRPGAPWSYPQTGVGLPLPLKPPYDR